MGPKPCCNNQSFSGPWTREIGPNERKSGTWGLGLRFSPWYFRFPLSLLFFRCIAPKKKKQKRGRWAWGSWNFMRRSSWRRWIFWNGRENTVIEKPSSHAATTSLPETTTRSNDLYPWQFLSILFSSLLISITWGEKKRHQRDSFHPKSRKLFDECPHPKHRWFYFFLSVERHWF